MTWNAWRTKSKPDPPSIDPWDWQRRINHYGAVLKYPVSLTVGPDGRLYAFWLLGNDYRVKSGYYGGYPATYLQRMKALYPDRSRVLHLFSGKVDTETFPGDTVDINPDNGATYVDDAQTLLNVPLWAYDLVMCDPPYSVEDAEHYKTTMVSRNKVFRALAGVSRGTDVVWLDQVLPMWRKDTFDLIGSVNIVRSSNHRVRDAFIFRRK